MAPEHPLITRLSVLTQACAHCPNSPPSHTSTACSQRSIAACTQCPICAGVNVRVEAPVSLPLAIVATSIAGTSAFNNAPASSSQGLCSCKRRYCLHSPSARATGFTCNARQGARSITSILWLSDAASASTTISVLADSFSVDAKATVKSGNLPSSNTQSASCSTRPILPSDGSAKPRGLSIAMTGTPVASLSSFIRSGIRDAVIAGPVTMTGFFAPARASMTSPKCGTSVIRPLG